MAQIDAYQEITDRIVKALESGTSPWVKPWASCGAPRNAISGREYSGINTILLGMSPYMSQSWLTFKQAQDVGANVRKGEHGTRIVFFKAFKVKDANAEGEGKEKSIPVLRTFTVFNTQQIDNLPEKYHPAKPESLPLFTDNLQAEGLLNKAHIEHGKAQACFIPSMDIIHLPNKTDFSSHAHYYATALHELTHWTGAKNRLARDFSGRFGDAAYAFEELCADLGSAFLCAHCQIDGHTLDNHASYIASWIKVLKSDKKAIFTASSQARQAMEYLTGKQEVEQEAIAA
jgi:antirestriction protein ArdC